MYEDKRVGLTVFNKIWSLLKLLIMTAGMISLIVIGLDDFITGYDEVKKFRNRRITKKDMDDYTR